MEALISVIVPAYNVALYLPRCLDSLLSQTYPEMEIIVVNDGSTDETAAVMEEYAQRFPEKIKCLHQENQGVTKARFAGIEAASGEWIGFADGDDEVEPDMYERLLENAKKYQADISHCGYQTIVNSGERIHYFYNTGKIVEQDHKSGLQDLLEGKFVEPTLCDKIFKRELLKQLLIDNRLDLSVRFNEDLLMNYLLFRYSDKAIFEDFCPYHYLTRSSSASRMEFRLDRVLDPVKVRRNILEISEPETVDLAWRKYLVTAGGAYTSLFNRADCKDEAKELKKEILANKDKWKTLTRKERSKLRLQIYTPHLYRRIYYIYVKFFQNKVYE